MGKQDLEKQRIYTEEVLQSEIISINQPVIEENVSVPLPKKKEYFKTIFQIG